MPELSADKKEIADVLKKILKLMPAYKELRFLQKELSAIIMLIWRKAVRTLL